MFIGPAMEAQSPIWLSKFYLMMRVITTHPTKHIYILSTRRNDTFCRKSRDRAPTVDYGNFQFISIHTVNLTNNLPRPIRDRHSIQLAPNCLFHFRRLLRPSKLLRAYCFLLQFMSSQSFPSKRPPTHIPFRYQQRPRSTPLILWDHGVVSVWLAKNNQPAGSVTSGARSRLRYQLAS